MGHMGSKTKSVGKSKKKNPCVHSKRLSFGKMIMKLVETVCLDEIFDDFENGSCGVKN